MGGILMAEKQEVLASDMIDQEKFNVFWEWFKENFTNSDADMIQGYLILKAGCAILEQAFKLDPVEAVAEGEDDGA
jgi:hypothetical protein